MSEALIIGFGNIDRGDDGVACHVINGLRRVWKQEPLNAEDSGLDSLGLPTDSIFIPQLVPELLDILTAYNNIIFVDAHVYENREDLYCEAVLPEFAPATFTHHITPAMLLALLKALYQREPAGYIVSIRGHDFDFRHELSAGTSALIKPAMEYIRQLLPYGQ